MLPPEELDGLVVSTKVGDECPPYSNNGGHNAMSKDGVLCSVEHSLGLLQRDSVDILLLHDPTLPELEYFLNDQHGGMRALESLREEGVVKYLGIGCVEHEQQRMFMEYNNGADCDLVLTVNDFNLVRRYGSDESGAFPLAQERDMGVINAGAFYMGLLADPLNSWSLGFKKDLDQPGKG
jgi:D-threo-aldose 1-dehydrogenase